MCGYEWDFEISGLGGLLSLLAKTDRSYLNYVTLAYPFFFLSFFNFSAVCSVCMLFLFWGSSCFLWILGSYFFCFLFFYRLEPLLFLAPFLGSKDKFSLDFANLVDICFVLSTKLFSFAYWENTACNWSCFSGW